jgi:hypothetical protein
MQATSISVSRVPSKEFATPPYSVGDEIFNGYATEFQPVYVPKRSKQSSIIARVNKLATACTVALWSLAILGYGLDVASTNEVSKLQDQARRLSEQNTELSARVLKAISFQGIQDRALGQLSLVVPEQVLIVKEVPPNPVPEFHPQKHHIPLLTGF